MAAFGSRMQKVGLIAAQLIIFGVVCNCFTVSGKVKGPMSSCPAFVSNRWGYCVSSHSSIATARASTGVSPVTKLSAYVDTDAGVGGGSGDSRSKQKKAKLSRPERKALQRERKAQRGKTRRKSNTYRLHSTAISQLTKDSTADDVMRAIKRAQNMHDEHDIRNIERFLLEEVDAGFAYGYRGSLLARLAVAALHMNNHELARIALEVRRNEHRPAMLPMESAAVVRGLLRVHNTTDAMDVLDDELSLPQEGTPLDTDATRERLKHRALALASIVSRHFYEGHPIQAVRACKQLIQLGPLVRLAKLSTKDLGMPWKRIIQGAAQCESGRRDGTINIDEKQAALPCNLVYSVLDAMTTFPSTNEDAVYEVLSNALIRRTVFVKGAVDMAGLPNADRGEVAFIGRSNVGKSSLINMIANRRSLAYTSKRPGKTQQFNFFAVNDKPGLEKQIRYGDSIPGEKDPDSFYFVDLPGFGYARVPQRQRQAWSDFMADYLSNRKNLRVVFHLVDARLGPTHEDEKIMMQAGSLLPSHVTYVVLLTKADKNVKGSAKFSGKVSDDVMDHLRAAMRNGKVANSPVILTSAETKVGRDDIWRYVRLAAEC